MPKLRELTAHLERLAPPALQESYDNSGLLVGDPDTDITKALISLDCTEAVVEEAAATGCNLIVSHHPIIFKGLKGLTGRNYVERTVIKAIQKGIALYAIHTNLDNVATGVNAEICRRLGLLNCRILAPMQEQLTKIVVFCPTTVLDDGRRADVHVREALFGAGAGHIGDYSHCSYNLSGAGTFLGGDETDPFAGKKGELHTESETRIETIAPRHLVPAVVRALIEAHPYEEPAYDLYPLSNAADRLGAGMIGELAEPLSEKDALLHVKARLQTECVRYTPLRDTPVRTVAVCGGAGSFLTKEAAGAGADLFVTGDVKYHEFFDADGRLVIADVGHYESEQFTIDLLHKVLTEKFPNFAVAKVQTTTNPVNYL